MATAPTQVNDIYNDLLTSTARKRRPALVEQVKRAFPLLYWLEKAGKKRFEDGGYQIREDVGWGENDTIKLFEFYDEVPIAPSEGTTAAFYNWKSITANVSISRQEERMNSGSARIFKLLDDKLRRAENSLRTNLANILFGVHGTRAKTFCGGDFNALNSVGGPSNYNTDEEVRKGFNSLDHIVRGPWGMADPTASTTVVHTVGGIPVTMTSGAGSAGGYQDWNQIVISAQTNIWWMNHCNPGWDLPLVGQNLPDPRLGDRLSDEELTWSGDFDGGTNGANLWDAMRSMWNRLSDGNDPPDLLLCGQQLFEQYERILVPFERFTDRSLGDVGFRNLQFYAATIMLDMNLRTRVPTSPSAAVPAAPMYFLNSKYLSWVVDKGSDFAHEPFRTMPTQLARTMNIVLMANLTCNRRSKQGVIYFANIGATGWCG